jgi:hypothetical protein
MMYLVPVSWTSVGEEDNIQGVEDTRDPAKNGQEDVDEEVGIAPAFEKDAERREEYGGDDLDDVTGHVSRGCEKGRGPTWR